MLYMKEKKAKKTNRNFYVSDFIFEILEREGAAYGGNGVTASAAILAFSKLTEEAKKNALKEFRNAEIEMAFPEQVISLLKDAQKNIPTEQRKNPPSKHA